MIIGWAHWAGILQSERMELSSSEESEEGPLLKGLFTDDEGSDNSSENDSYCASDREWRDAVKAAVETEIQYQVQLRLSLESPGFLSQEKQWDNDTGELLPQLQWRTRRQQRSDSLPDERITNPIFSVLIQSWIQEQMLCKRGKRENLNNLLKK